MSKNSSVDHDDININFAPDNSLDGYTRTQWKKQEQDKLIDIFNKAIEYIEGEKTKYWSYDRRSAPIVYNTGRKQYNYHYHNPGVHMKSDYIGYVDIISKVISKVISPTIKNNTLYLKAYDEIRSIYNKIHKNRNHDFDGITNDYNEETTKVTYYTLALCIGIAMLNVMGDFENANGLIESAYDTYFFITWKRIPPSGDISVIQEPYEETFETWRFGYSRWWQQLINHHKDLYLASLSYVQKNIYDAKRALENLKYKRQDYNSYSLFPLRPGTNPLSFSQTTKKRNGQEDLSYVVGNSVLVSNGDGTNRVVTAVKPTKRSQDTTNTTAVLPPTSTTGTQIGTNQTYTTATGKNPKTLKTKWWLRGGRTSPKTCRSRIKRSRSKKTTKKSTRTNKSTRTK